MQKNEVIGITAVFLLTFCLIALYHFMSALGRLGKRRVVHTDRARNSRENRGSNPSPRLTAVRHDRWLSRAAETTSKSGEARKGSEEHRGRQGA